MDKINSKVAISKKKDGKIIATIPVEVEIDVQELQGQILEGLNLENFNVCLQKTETNSYILKAVPINKKEVAEQERLLSRERMVHTEEQRGEEGRERVSVLSDLNLGSIRSKRKFDIFDCYHSVWRKLEKKEERGSLKFSFKRENSFNISYNPPFIPKSPFSGLNSQINISEMSRSNMKKPNLPLFINKPILKNNSANQNDEGIRPNFDKERTRRRSIEYSEERKINNVEDVISFNWNFKRLFNFLNSYYINKNFDISSIEYFNIREKVILARMIDLFHKFNNSVSLNSDNFPKNVEKYFTRQKSGQKYKVTNGKRFVYRKIKGVMMKKFRENAFRKHFSKKKLDEEFFNHYFRRTDNFNSLSEEEKNQLKSMLTFYDEIGLHLLWKFKAFCKDFIEILNDFEQLLQTFYFQPKLNSLKKFLEIINDENLENIKIVKLPYVRLPLPHSVIELYVSDFTRGFMEKQTEFKYSF